MALPVPDTRLGERRRMERETPDGAQPSRVHQAFVLASITLVAAYWSALAILGMRDVVIASFERFSDFAAYYALFVIAQTALIGALMRGAGERFGDLGLSFAAFRDALRTRQVYLATVLLMIMQPFVATFLRTIQWNQPAPNPLTGTMTTENLPVWMFFGVVGGGFREELERAFCITRFERGFGAAGLGGAVLVDAVIFGLGHWRTQGTIGMVTNTIAGVAFSLVFLRRRRVADAMVAHAVLDLIVVFSLSTQR